MDSVLAKKMTGELRGKCVGGWLIREFINHGKSAVVFLAEKGGQHAALKIIDSDLVAQYGHDEQLARIKRERSLIGKEHPNLIRSLDGGEENALLFIVMELFDGTNLAEALPKIPPEAARPLLAQIASAAKYLEDQGFAHRDIKPENIGISHDYKSVKLLDLGVLKPLADLGSITDHGMQKAFIGTVQYGPPEFIYREEAESVEAWRAITFYQLGAVLHDLLMRKPLFGDRKIPYARLVRAVVSETPRIDAPGIDPDLRLLAKSCLMKSPEQRLALVKWEDFSRPYAPGDLDAVRKRIAMHTAVEAAGVPQSPDVAALIRKQLYALRTSIHAAVVGTCKAEKDLPRYSQRLSTKSPLVVLRATFDLPDGNYVAVFCSGEVLDAHADMHDLRLSACVAPAGQPIPAEPDAAAAVNAKKGPLSDEDIRSAVQEYLLLAYAAALEKSAEAKSGLAWLDVRRNG